MKRTFSALVILTICLITLTQCKKECVNNERCKWGPTNSFCNANARQVYYDNNEKKCKEVHFGGCGDIPFSSMEECEKKCGCK
jgi:hypothetical protein